MTGLEEYNKKNETILKHYIEEHPEVKGYCNYIKIDKSLNTVRMYTRVVQQFLAYIKKDSSELTFDDFAEYNAIKTKENGENATSGWLVNRYHAIKNYSTYLYQTGIIPKDYMQMIKRPKFFEDQITLSKREKGFLTKEEIQQYIARVREGCGEYLNNPYKQFILYRDIAVVMVLLTTGIRRSALVKLDVQDIDFERNILWVVDKGNKTREYVLPKETVSYIKKWLFKRVGYREINTDALFITKYGLRMCPDAVEEIVKKYAINIKGKHITPHKLRATFGTQLYEETKDIYFVQKAMGHSSPTVTERYVRGQNGVMKQAADIMSKII